LRFCGKRITTYKVASEACPEKSMAGPEWMEDTVVTFEGSLDRMEAMDMEATPGAKEAAVEHQKLHRDERRHYRVTGRPVRRSTLHCAMSPRAKEEDQRQCWAPVEVVCCPKKEDTSRHPCSAQGSRQGWYCKGSP
jgi:hypothetical protein